MTLYVAKMSSDATLPTRGSAEAAGYDLYSARAINVPAFGRALIPTDLRIVLPLGTYGRIAPRSGLASNHGIDVGAGVIDRDYRGNVKVLLFNHTENDFQVSVGDRVAQLICEKIERPIIEEMEQCDLQRQTTDRGEEGFGSTGMK